MMDLYPGYHKIDFVRAFFVQIDNRDVGRLVVGDVVNIPQSLDLILNNEYMEKIMKSVKEIKQEPRYFF